MIPIWHKKCGEQMAWFIRDEPWTRGGHVLAREYMRMDGTQPKAGERVAESCPACGEPIKGWGDMIVGNRP